MNKISNDLIASEDALRRKPFAKNIVFSIINSFEQVDESIVVGICGKWGSGKSTLIEYIESEIKKHYSDDKSMYKVIQFNSWANSNETGLQRALIEVILKALEKANWKHTIKTANEKIKKYLRYLEYVKYLKYAHPVILNWFNGIDQFRKKNEVITIDELKATVNELIEANGVKLFITIDDLDRLDHKEIVTVFKTLKLSVNFVNTVFFVAYDKEVVINALVDTYGSNAEEYLEKIIQVDFSVPELLDEQVENLFFDKIREIIKANEIEVKEPEIFSLWKYHGLRQCFQNPRDVKRYCNSLILSLPNVKNNVNVIDFLALEAIKVFDHNCYNRLYESLLEHKRASMMRSSDLKRDYLEKFVTGETLNLVDYLFQYQDESHEFNNGLIHKRLKDTEFFQRYFALSISNRDVAEQEIVSFVDTGTNKAQVLKNAYESGRIKNLLRRVGDRKLSEKMKVKDDNIFHDFLNFWENKKITSELDELIWHAYFNMAHSFHDSLRGARLAVEALEMSPSSVQPMRLVFNHFIFSFKRQGRTDSEFYGTIPDELLRMDDRLYNSFIGNMKKVYGDYFHKINTKNDDFSCNVFMDSFASYCPEEYKIEARNSMKNSNFILFLLKNFMVSVDAISGKPFKVDYSKRDVLLPETFFDDFIKGISEIRMSLLSESEKTLIDYFSENNVL